MAAPLTVLAVDDEAPALSELAYLLGKDDRVGTVLTAGSGTEALLLTREHSFDAVFCDIRMPGISGLDLAALLSRFPTRPPLVFISAHDEHARRAFDVEAVDYVQKPVRPERLAEAVRRVASRRDLGPAPAAPEPEIPVLVNGITRLVGRSQVRYLEAHGDYVRVHTVDGSHIVRARMIAFETSWADAGFVRIHRTYLVSLDHITEVRIRGKTPTVLLGNEELQASRRGARQLREILTRRAGG